MLILEAPGWLTQKSIRLLISTLDLRIVGLSPTLCIETTKKLNFKKYSFLLGSSESVHVFYALVFALNSRAEREDQLIGANRFTCTPLLFLKWRLLL